MIDRPRRTTPIDKALALLDNHFGPTEVRSSLSLLEQCEAFCAALEAKEPEPVRMLHHFACTGGTVIAKCIAAVPNTVLLSEIDPLSTLQTGEKAKRFAPTDLILNLRNSLRSVNDETIETVFADGFLAMYKSLTLEGRRLVIREHTHSHFCTKVDPAGRPSVHDLIARIVPVLSVVTVRHPLDSFLSLQANRWIHFSPSTLEEYSRRYLAFLTAYEKVRVIRYEDFVADVEHTLQEMCDIFKLPHNPYFLELLPIISISGDSGRSSNIIEPRSRREIPEAVAEQVLSSPSYFRLCQDLGYEPSPTNFERGRVSDQGRAN
ncbi:hypothetical protein [Pseudorhodoplanes sp.]|uniref:hypothetical protein n=1 Tax=Pseudorhodoplanes sp. TaxID=1934341 RepID=UPI003D0E5CA5